MSLQTDVYVIANKGSQTFLDLNNGSPDNGTKVQGWQNLSIQEFAPNQQWLISQVDGSPGVYTLRNMSGGSFLDLESGLSADGTQIQCWEKNPPGTVDAPNQQWKISKAEVNDFWRIQNVRGKTFVDIDNGNPSDGTKIQGWQHLNTDNQMWSIKAVTLSGRQINDILKANSFVKKELPSFLPNAKYLTFPPVVRSSLWDGLGLSPTSFRAVNADTPAYIVKAAVSEWGNARLRVDGFPYLFGIACGQDDKGIPHAKNWYISDARGRGALLFFDPLIGSDDFSPGMQVASGIF